jgi:hypothetical protein
MSHPVIPAPVRFDGGGVDGALRSGTRMAYPAASLAPIIERFCSDLIPGTRNDDVLGCWLSPL